MVERVFREAPGVRLLEARRALVERETADGVVDGARRTVLVRLLLTCVRLMVAGRLALVTEDRATSGARDERCDLDEGVRASAQVAATSNRPATQHSPFELVIVDVIVFSFL